MLTPISVDRHQAGQSLIHQLVPSVKLVVTLLYILSNVFLPDGAWLAFGLSWGVLLALNILAKLGLLFTFKRSFIALPFTLAAFTLLFTLPGQPLLTVVFGFWQLTISDVGLVRFLSIVVRSWLSVQVAILLTATTHFPDLAHGLRHLRVPSVFISIISFMYRYLFLLSEEAQRLLRARAARSAQPIHNTHIFWRARVTGHMIGQLFIRGFERSERVYNAMLARGYDGRFLTFNPHHMHSRDWLAILLSLISVAAIQFFAF